MLTEESEDTRKDRKLARANALAISEELESKPIPYSRIHRGEPTYFYRIPLHQGEFWFKVLMSTHQYVFQGDHNKLRSFPVPFSASLKYPWENAATVERITRISRELRIEVFGPPHRDSGPAAKLLLGARVRSLLQDVDWHPVRLFFVNPAQLLVRSDFQDANHCARQAQLFRQILLTLYDEMKRTSS